MSEEMNPRAETSIGSSASVSSLPEFCFSPPLPANKSAGEGIGKGIDGRGLGKSVGDRVDGALEGCFVVGLGEGLPVG